MSTIDYKLLANKHIRDLTPYQPGKPIEELERELGITSSIKLASNENPLGPSPHAIAAAHNALLNAHIYPDGGSYELKKTLASFLSVDANQITVGNGSENILELIIKSYLSEDDHAIISQYAFLTIPILIKSYGAIATVTQAVDWGHDIDAIINAINDQTKMIFIVNPNNPTGTYTNTKDFDRLMSSVPNHILVIADEAYSEYIQQDDYPNTIAYLSNYRNLIICRTFSKAYGLAALRLGYAISSPEVADILNRARLPFNVNSIAASAGIQAIKDQDHVRKSIDVNHQGMKQMIAGLTKLKLDYIPSLGNFITINVKNGKSVYQRLLHKGVIVRPLDAYGMPQHIRVTIGTSSEIDRFLNAVEIVCEETV